MALDEDFMRTMASKDKACTTHDHIPQDLIDGYASRHPITEKMDEIERRVWDSLDDEDRRMIQSDRVYYGTNYGTGCGPGDEYVTFRDVIGIRQFD